MQSYAIKPEKPLRFSMRSLEKSTVYVKRSRWRPFNEYLSLQGLRWATWIPLGHTGQESQRKCEVQRQERKACATSDVSWNLQLVRGKIVLRHDRHRFHVVLGTFRKERHRNLTSNSVEKLWKSRRGQDDSTTTFLVVCWAQGWMFSWKRTGFSVPFSVWMTEKWNKINLPKATDLNEYVFCSLSFNAFLLLVVAIGQEERLQATHSSIEENTCE